MKIQTLNRTFFIGLLQLLIALGMLAFIFTHIDLNIICDLTAQATPSYIFLAFVALTCQIVVASYRWLKIIRITGFSPPLMQCVGSFAAGSFVNTTLPGGVGGDILRMWFTARHGIPPKIAAYTVILDRVINLMGLGLPLTIALIPYVLWVSEKYYYINVVALSFGTILIVAFLGLAIIDTIIAQFKINLPFIFHPLLNLSHMIINLLQQPRELINLFSVVMLGYFFQIIAIIFLSYGLHISLPIKDILIGIPIVLLLSAIPITPGGWGIRESTMVIILKHSNVPTEAALGVSILFGIGSTLSSLPPGAWWFIHRIWSNNTSEHMNSKVTDE